MSEPQTARQRIVRILTSGTMWATVLVLGVGTWWLHKGGVGALSMTGGGSVLTAALAGIGGQAVRKAGARP